MLLRWLLYRTRLGISMRAVVDSRSLAGLTGAKPSVVSGTSWALGCMTAGLAGILIAPETGLVVENLALLIVVAAAAAAIAQLKSLPWAIAGGLIIGLSKSFAGVFLSFDQNWSYAPEAIPAVILFIALLFLPQARLETGKIKITKRTERLTKPWEALVGSLVVFLLVTFWAKGWIPWFGTNFGERSDVWLGRGAGFMVLGVITLSLVPLIGWAGQVSFANFAIAGIGAVLFSHFGGQNGDPKGILLVMAVCAVVGVAVALPALRLKGLYLALATLAFAEFADKVIVRHPNMIDPSASGTLFEPLKLFGFSISTNTGDRQAFVIFLALIFCIFMLGFMLMRRGRFARRWIALSDSPAASATIGVNLTVQKVLVFALSGAVAGFAGCMLGISSGALRVDSFPLFAGLPLVLLLAVQGVRYPIAAFMAVIGLASFPALKELLGEPQLDERHRAHRPRHRRHHHGVPARGGGVLRRPRPRRHAPLAPGRPGGEGARRGQAPRAGHRPRRDRRARPQPALHARQGVPARPGARTWPTSSTSTRSCPRRVPWATCTPRARATAAGRTPVGAANTEVGQ